MDRADTERLLEKLKTTLVWWKDAISETFFMATPETVFNAEKDINLMIYTDVAGLAECWFDNLGIDIPEKDIYKYGGWRFECLAARGEYNLVFRHELNEDKEHGLYFELTPDQWPCDAFEECFGDCCYGPDEIAPC